jgi:nucleotide-binding universal stress UspA family protein
VNADGADGDDHKLLRGSPTMLWMSRPGSRTGGCVIAALDPDPEDSVRQALAMNVLRSAQTLAQAEKLPLVAAHTWQLFGEQMLRSRRPGGVEDADIDAMRDKARRQARERLDAALSALEAPVDAATPHGVAADALIALATERDADVMVIGTVGRAGMAGMLAGETAEDVLHGAPCDVVAVPPPAG